MTDFKIRYPVMPDKIPKYAVGDRIKLVSNQHPYNGKMGVIRKVLPAQRAVFYMVLFVGKENTTSINERMLVKL